MQNICQSCDLVRAVRRSEVDVTEESICRIFAKFCESILEKCERLSANLRQEMLIYENNKFKLRKYNCCFKYIYIFFTIIFGHVECHNFELTRYQQDGDIESTKVSKLPYLHVSSM